VLLRPFSLESLLSDGKGCMRRFTIAQNCNIKAVYSILKGQVNLNAPSSFLEMRPPFNSLMKSPDNAFQSIVQGLLKE